MTVFNQQHQKVHSQINIGSITISIHTTENIAGMVEKAVRLFHTKHFDEAVTLLDKVILSDEDIADAYYYRGIASLKGKRPKSVLKSSIERITRDLFAAIELESSQAHYYYLLALVLYDFYIMNGFSVDKTQIESLLDEAQHCKVDIPKCNELIQYTDSLNSPVINILKQYL
jgi:hypothetical protein